MSDNNNKKAIRFKEVKDALTDMYKGNKTLKEENITKFFCDCPEYDDKSRDNKCVRVIELMSPIQYVFDFYNEDDGLPTSQSFINPENITNKTFMPSNALNKLCCDRESFNKMSNYEMYDINLLGITSEVEINDNYITSNPYNFKIIGTYNDEGFETPLTIIENMVLLSVSTEIIPKYNGLIRKRPTIPSRNYPSITIQIENVNPGMSSYYLYDLNFTFYDNGDDNLLDIEFDGEKAAKGFLNSAFATNFLQNVNQLTITGDVRKILYNVNLLDCLKSTTQGEFYAPVVRCDNIRWYDNYGKIILNNSLIPLHRLDGNNLIIAEDPYKAASYNYYFLISYYTSEYTFDVLYNVNIQPSNHMGRTLFPCLRLDKIHNKNIEFANALTQDISMNYSFGDFAQQELLLPVSDSIVTFDSNENDLNTCLFDNGNILILSEDNSPLDCDIRLGGSLTLVEFVQEGKLNMVNGLFGISAVNDIDAFIDGLHNDYMSEKYTLEFR